MFGSLQDNENTRIDMVGPYITELHFDERPSLEIADSIYELQDHCGKIKILKQDDASFHIAFEEHLASFDDGDIPYQITALLLDEKNTKGIEESLNQSWSWKEAKEVVERSRYTVLVTDILGAGLDYSNRIQLYQQFLFMLCCSSECTAIHFIKSQNVVSPERYLLRAPWEEGYNVLFGIVNIRLFRIEGTNGDILMDTLGLGAFGSIDLQCYFNGIDPNQVANILFYYASYLYTNGDIINDGETIQGRSVGEKWKCNHKLSVVAPERIVLDIRPNEENAGER